MLTDLLKGERIPKVGNRNSFSKRRRDEHISRDLHDSVGQLLVAAKLKIINNKKKEAEETLALASEELRNIYDELEPRSLEIMGLGDALEWYLLKFFPDDFPYHIDVKLAEKLPTKIKFKSTVLYKRL